MEEEQAQGAPEIELSLLERAEKAAQRIEDANKRKEELLAREEKLRAWQMLGGKTDGASQPAPAPKPETAKEYAQRVMGGKYGKN